ncbi:zinc-dependent alcohol dehydrogenase family protein [Streptomyces capoamus]|uniref:NADPH:quinone reductase n=1 Tax=Streptomyces capoamus TaxID=68183 RepID=A0A919EZ50_9ACTN|nr:zinc-dependent alcohol dehydrogenase family protein [Streptomyces capoamus]GGW10871.1 NADPH:quinone reductase [Streptomyces libani subsp. rufus]GHG60885.1 NADPH:quinone reductase [Streptomyces capoamus]
MAATVRFHETGGPEVLRLEDVEPGEPGPGEVLLRIEAIGVNRADGLFRGGVYIEPVKQFPARLGTEAAGVVEAVGPGVTAVAPGQPVSVVPGFSPNDYGVYAERALVPASAVLPRSPEVDPVSGAAVWMPYLTAYGALVEVGGVRAGDVAVVTAASSSLGLAAIRTANRLGATPVAVTRTRAKRQRLLDDGAAEVIVSDEEDVAGRVLELTGGRGAEHVLDAVAGPGVRELARAVAADGTLLLWGMQSGEPTPFPGFDLGMPPLNMRTYTVTREVLAVPERMRRAVAFVDSGLRSGTLRPEVDRTFPLADVVAAHRYMEAGAQYGKIVLTTGR